MSWQWVFENSKGCVNVDGMTIIIFLISSYLVTHKSVGPHLCLEVPYHEAGIHGARSWKSAPLYSDIGCEYCQFMYYKACFVYSILISWFLHDKLFLIPELMLTIYVWDDDIQVVLYLRINHIMTSVDDRYKNKANFPLSNYSSILCWKMGYHICHKC